MVLIKKLNLIFFMLKIFFEFLFLLREWAYYSFQVNDDGKEISIETSVSVGSIDLYVSQDVKRPNSTENVTRFIFFTKSVRKKFFIICL